MAADFRPVIVPRAFEDVLRQLKDAIADGSLNAGDRLPPERELAEQFRVSRTSVREALRVLEALGIIGVRRGADNGAVLLSEPSNVFTTVLDLLVTLRHVPVADVVEFRVMVESTAARHLAAHRVPSVTDALDALLVEMENPELARADFHRLDALFHIAMVRAAGNKLLDLVETAADGILRRLITDVALVGADWPAVRTRLIAEHRAIHAAIASGDPHRAADLVTRHVEHWGGLVGELRPG